MTEKATAIFEANCTKYSVKIECSTKISIALAASVSVTEPGTEIACEALKTKILTEYGKYSGISKEFHGFLDCASTVESLELKKKLTESDKGCYLLSEIAVSRINLRSDPR